MTVRKRILIFGATSSIAEHCARLWNTDTCDFELIARNQDKLQTIATDLQVRNPLSTVHCRYMDFTQPDSIVEETQLVFKNGPVDIVLIAHGFLPDQRRCETEPNYLNDTLIVNAVSPALIAETCVTFMLKQEGGSLIITGSVAGDRGRKSNYVYGSTKGLITRYVQGLQHRLANTPIHAMLVKPGPTDTPMTTHLKEKGVKLANVEKVAQDIVLAQEKRKNIIYTPSKWWGIMMIIRHIPDYIFNKLNI